MSLFHLVTCRGSLRNRKIVTARATLNVPESNGRDSSEARSHSKGSTDRCGPLGGNFKHRLRYVEAGYKGTFLRGRDRIGAVSRTKIEKAK